MILADPGRTQWDLKWTMLGTPVRVHPFFWLISLFLSYSPHIPFTWALLSLAAIFFSILVHEFGHALSSRQFGETENTIVLYQCGGLCIHGSVSMSHPQRIWILFWGPGAGFVLGVLAGGVKVLSPDLNPAFEYLLQQLIWFNLIWGAFNLLVPVFPLDAGQILREFVQWKMPARGDIFVFTISFYAGIAATVFALGYALFEQGGESRAFFPVFLFASLAYSNYLILKQLKAGYTLDGGEKEEPRQPWERDPDWWKKG